MNIEKEQLLKNKIPYFNVTSNWNHKRALLRALPVGKSLPRGGKTCPKGDTFVVVTIIQFYVSQR